ncbi:MAG: hypothetical protein ACI8Y8_003218 [Planctomycetota bacterium]|jgi:hypothetical protein
MRIEQWTAPASGGVAVVVLRGSGARERLRRIGVEWGDPDGSPDPGPRLVRLVSGGEQLDEALVLQRADDGFEVHVHGSPPLVARVLAILKGPDDGAVPPASEAPPSSPAERAWGRMSGAASELGARILLDQAEGAFEREIQGLRGLPAAELMAAVTTLQERGRRASYLLDATTIVLTGPVNAGKSTLFNLLVGSERTLVSPEQGTTRDAIAERAQLGPWPVLLVDTAGQRDLPAPETGQVADAAAVERAGQQLAESVRREADWGLELRRATRAEVDLEPQEGGAAILWTCCDELRGDPSDWPVGGVSAKGEPARAVAAVQARFEARFELLSPHPDLWRPGRAVPFEPGQVLALRGLADAARAAAAGAPALPGNPGAESWLERLLH